MMVLLHRTLAFVGVACTNFWKPSAFITHLFEMYTHSDHASYMSKKV